ncbi:GNAT family N-acetyltransferase [Prauserella rugosa]|uniref:N-acetylglutamate synthase-like GNAT family acetyltransferase n=1 Tax=Prauserella rugosa TaxID=43354 RepID=A0A660CE94_9PSEU|nr:GNAT family N-acetyltransferase [Prauserella rugosa]KMS82722.1 hypothetical protein ACZ91_56950 [Streptomyces regensis]TWH21712.1 N-acetylglutamate synthase-like GNAT family acetyltransferase [Prauserella rugosa]
MTTDQTRPRVRDVDGIVVRTAELADVEALVELRGEMFDAMGVSGGTAGDSDAWRGPARRWFADRIDNPSYRFVVVERAGRVVSCAVGAIRDAAPSPAVPHGRDVLISNVCTRTGERGRGYGRVAFTAVLDWAHASGVGRAELMATDAGESMYVEAGFTRNPHPVMRAPLDADVAGTFS